MISNTKVEKITKKMKNIWPTVVVCRAENKFERKFGSG